MHHVRFWNLDAVIDFFQSFESLFIYLAADLALRVPGAELFKVPIL